MPRLRHHRVLLVGETVGPATVGLSYLASYLRRKGIDAYCQGHDSCRTREALRANIKQMLERVRPTLFGISLKWFPHMARALEIAKIAKELSPDLTVVLGGNTASYYWRELIKEPVVDCIIRGDGEVPLLALCRGDDHVPNLIERGGKKLPLLGGDDPGIEYIESQDTEDVYLSHLDSIYLDPSDPQKSGSFFLYSGKRCNKKCFYCGGCATAMHTTFGSARPFFRKPNVVRADLAVARAHTEQFLFDFDFEPDGISQADYFREIFTDSWLSQYAAYFYFWRMPQAGTLDLLARTFGRVTTTIDLVSLSAKHRAKLTAERRLGVKPQPTDREILDIFDNASRYNHFTIDINLIAGMPLMEIDDFAASMEMVKRLTTDYKCLGEIQWGPLHAQPGAPIVGHAENFGMRSPATSYSDFLEFSRRNLEKPEYPDWRGLHYPFIYYQDLELFDASMKHYDEVNGYLRQRGESARGGGPTQTL